MKHSKKGWLYLHLTAIVYYNYSWAKLYESGKDDPMAIGFGFLTHWMV